MTTGRINQVTITKLPSEANLCQQRRLSGLLHPGLRATVFVTQDCNKAKTHHALCREALRMTSTKLPCSPVLCALDMLFRSGKVAVCTAGSWRLKSQSLEKTAQHRQPWRWHLMLADLQMCFCCLGLAIGK